MYNDNYNMNPDEFFGGYFNYYNNMQPINTPNPFHSLYIALGIVIGLGMVFAFFFLRKKNEKKVKGAVRIIYNFLSMNKFYAEEIIRLLSLLSILAISTTGIWLIVNGYIADGLVTLVLGNILARVVFELIVMFIILCRKSVSMDRRLSKLEAFYSDDFSDEDSDESDFCDCSLYECDCCEECSQPDECDYCSGAAESSDDDCFCCSEAEAADDTGFRCESEVKTGD